MDWAGSALNGRSPGNLKRQRYQDMRLAVIACEMLYREISHCVSRSKKIVGVRFMQKGLHSVGHEKMSSTLQGAIDRVAGDIYDAILLGYGLCSNGVAGLRSARLPLVVPRAHDCITLMLGCQTPRTLGQKTGK